eukprot:scaffold1953_cov176-Amphora_coffeaeformis.AAC.2
MTLGGASLGDAIVPEERLTLRDGAVGYFYGSPNFSVRNTGRGLSASHRERISARLRWTVNALAMTACFLFSGILFGWAPLKMILIREGQFRSTCADASSNDPCTNQLVEFNFIFTIAQFCLNLASLPVGFFLDHASKTLHFTLAGLLTAAILAASSCLFDASSLIFAVFNPLNNNYPDLFSRKNLFMGYSFVALALYGSMIFCWWQLERHDWKAVVDAEAAEAKENDDESDDEDNNKKPDRTPSGKEGTTSMIQKYLLRVKKTGLHEMPLEKQIRTFDFCLVLLFVSFHMLRTNFLIESVNEVVATYGDDDGFYAKVFGFVLPAGVAFIPFIEYTISKYGVVASLDVTNVLGVVWGAILLIPCLPLQAFNFFIFTGFRAYLYSTLSNFIAMTFGVATMGRVIGFSFTTSAIFTLLQYPAASYAEDGPEPEFTAVNSLSLALCLVPIVLVYYYKSILTAGTQQSTNNKTAAASETTSLL